MYVCIIRIIHILGVQNFWDLCKYLLISSTLDFQVKSNLFFLICVKIPKLKYQTCFYWKKKIAYLSNMVILSLWFKIEGNHVRFKKWCSHKNPANTSMSIGQLGFLVVGIHPWKLTDETYIYHPIEKKNIVFQPSILGFHINHPGVYWCRISRVYQGTYGSTGWKTIPRSTEWDWPIYLQNWVGLGGKCR